MKAVRYGRYGAAEVLELAEVPDPEPGPGEVLVEVHAASVNPVDWKIRSGLLRGLFEVRFPVIPGRDGAGVVAAAAGDVAGIGAGDEVCFIAGHGGQGSYAEKIVLAAGSLAPKAAGLSFAEAAAFPLAGMTAWAALVDAAPVEPGMKVLIHGGGGGVGGIAIQLARHLGAGTVAATCSAANVERVMALGADRAIAYDREDFADSIADQDLVFDTQGGEVHRKSYPVLRKGGTLVWITAGPVEDLSRTLRRHRRPGAGQARSRRPAPARRARRPGRGPARGRSRHGARRGRRRPPHQRERTRARQDRAEGPVTAAGGRLPPAAAGMGDRTGAIQAMIPGS